MDIPTLSEALSMIKKLRNCANCKYLDDEQVLLGDMYEPLCIQLRIPVQYTGFCEYWEYHGER